ncbi:MAG TPA: sigma-70 family RNA polymerase sigma factor [Polyangiaceae bacterium]|jgi:RNA polymerase sigma-70 factor (ECF subfamily)|nr:sigma-70 family RNA polymerase sigma factor [Polyangiaceae bacterium]
MNEEQRAEVERAVRAQCEKAEFAAAIDEAIRGYGPEIFGFLIATHANEADASDVFSDVCLALVRSLPEFSWQSSLRTWMYAVARNASHRFRRDASRRVGSRGRVGESALEDVANKVRTATIGFLRTQTRTKLEQLRDALAPEERELIVMRIDRGLSWDEIALAFHDDDTPSDAAAITRESQRLRKRFQLVKERLREMAKDAGLGSSAD